MKNNKSERIRISLMFLLLLVGFLIYVIRLFLVPAEMSIGVLNTISVWITVSLIPIIIPLVTEKKIMKISTLVFGGLVMLIDITLPLITIVENHMKEPITWAIIMIFICCVSGVTGIIKTVNWIKH